MMSKTVTGIVLSGSGIHLHRVVNALAYMPISDSLKYNIVHVGQDEQNLQCDILLYNKWTWAIDIEHIKRLQANGTKVVVDVDDYWDLPHTHHNYKHFKNAKLAEKTIEHIKNADAVICTTKRLAVELEKLNNKVVVIPNALPFDRDQYQPGNRERARELSNHSKTRFMYLAGSTHEHDVQLLDGVFTRIGDREHWLQERSEYLLCGYQVTKVPMFKTREDMEKGINYELKEVQGPYDHMADVFRKTKSFRIYPSVDLDNYLNYYDSADVAIVPLQQTMWNSMKSELKLIEAACKRIPVICSNVPPYSDCLDIQGVDFVDKDWLKCIKEYVKNPSYLKEQGEKLYEYGKQNYDLVQVNRLREELFTSL